MWLSFLERGGNTPSRRAGEALCAAKGPRTTTAEQLPPGFMALTALQEPLPLGLPPAGSAAQWGSAQGSVALVHTVQEQEPWPCPPAALQAMLAQPLCCSGPQFPPVSSKLTVICEDPTAVIL